MSLPSPETDLTPEEREAILNKVASAVVRRRLEVPTILFLELHRPLTFFGSQLVYFLAPMLGPFVGMDTLNRLAALLLEPGNLDRLVDRIEEQAHEREQPAPAPPATES